MIKRKKEDILGTSYFYDFYKKEAKKNNFEIIPYSDYKKILFNFHKTIARKIIEGFKVKIPFKLGYFYMLGRKKRIKIIDGKVIGGHPNWKETLKFWEENPEAKKEKKIIYYDNIHTDGYSYYLKWQKIPVIVRFGRLYTFKLSRLNRNELAKAIKEDKKRYRLRPDFKHLRKINEK